MDTGPSSWPPPSGRPKYGVFAEDGGAEAPPPPILQPAAPEPDAAPLPPPLPPAPAMPEAPAPLPPSSPAPSHAPPPVIAPSAFETKPGRGAARQRRRLGVMRYVGSALLVALLIVAILYFWGAAIAARGA